MMTALTENTASSSIAQPIYANTNAINRSYSTIGYDYHHHHHNPWEKPNYATFHYPPPTPYSMGTMSSTGGLSSLESMNKIHSSFDPTHPSSNFYRRHTESALPPIPPTSIYSSSTPNHPSASPFHYSHRMIHYHPPSSSSSSESLFTWNNEPSLMRTPTASYRDYLQSNSLPRYPINQKSTENLPPPGSIHPHYPSFFNMIPPMNFSFPSLAGSIPSNSTSTHRKRSIPSSKKRAHLTVQLRNEILKLKSQKPTIFVWEIQQNLLQNGICTAQTLPHATIIQRILNESVHRIKEEPKANVDLVMETLFQKSSPLTICLSPSQSPALSDNESGSECSICLETYRSGQEVSILSCSHEYHSSCIKEWMMKNRSCPMCRKDIHNQPQFVTLLI